MSDHRSTEALVADALRWCDHVERFAYTREDVGLDASPHLLAAASRKVAALARASAWQPIETWEGQPTGEEWPVIVCVSDGGLHDPIVGEAWFDPDDYGGTWWWANMSKEDGCSSPIEDMQHGTVTHWIPMFMPPIGTEPASPVAIDSYTEQRLQQGGLRLVSGSPTMLSDELGRQDREARD